MLTLSFGFWLFYFKTTKHHCYHFFKWRRCKSNKDHLGGLRKKGEHSVLYRLTLLYVVHVSVCESALSMKEKQNSLCNSRSNSLLYNPLFRGVSLDRERHTSNTSVHIWIYQHLLATKSCLSSALIKCYIMGLNSPIYKFQVLMLPMFAL